MFLFLQNIIQGRLSSP